MNKKIILELISFFILVILSIITGLNGSTETFGVALCSAIIVSIPALYSLIPLINEHLFEINKRKNRLSDVTFTDRDEDVKDILKKLSMTEHIIQIKGDSPKCGKTWLAKRVCDFINHPKEIRNKDNIQEIPSYHNALYIDMKDKNDMYLDRYFEENIITNRDVLVFDHVSNLSAIFSKQEIFHFQLIYILENEQTIEPFLHIVSPFEKENINELHQKIREIYPAINCITQEEINILYNLTGGNIGKIYSLLSHEECISWLKDIAQNNFTDYEKKLNVINADLYCGNYMEAFKKLEKFKLEYENKLDKNNDLYFKYFLIKSDCEHLLNQYEAALATLSIISTPTFAFENKDYKLERYRAHYYKHLWECDNALKTLQEIQIQSVAVVTDAFGILLAKYFINDLSVPNSKHDSLTEFLHLFLKIENSNVILSDNEKNKIMRYKICYDFYNQKPTDMDSLIEQADKMIELYRAQNNRLLANAYVLRGEVYRLYGEFELAERDYQQSLLITSDDNIKAQVNIIRYYMFSVKKIELSPRFDLLAKESIIPLYENKNKYCEKLFHRINCIELGDINASEVINCFESRIMLIL